jgi:N-acetylmuramoyl-L-alanine amidase
MKVILDAGHGINTPGKGSPYALNGVEPGLYIREYQYCRWIVDAIARELKLRGVQVEKLVKDDNDMSLVERVSRANKIYSKDKDSFLVSVHLNASGNGSKWMPASYWSVWTSIGQTRSDIIADYLFTSAKKTFVGKRIASQRSDGDDDFENNFYILKNTNCPAVLTENFFQDNIEDVKYLLSDRGMHAVVDAHVNGIMEYIKAYNNDKKRTR